MLVPIPCLDKVVTETERAAAEFGGELARSIAKCFDCVPRSAVFSAGGTGKSKKRQNYESTNGVSWDSSDDRHRLLDRSQERDKKTLKSRRVASASRYSSETGTGHVSGSSRTSVTGVSSGGIIPDETLRSADAKSRDQGDGLGEAVTAGLMAALVGAVLSLAGLSAFGADIGAAADSDDDDGGDGDGGIFVDGAFFGGDDREINLFEGIDTSSVEAPSLADSTLRDVVSQRPPGRRLRGARVEEGRGARGAGNEGIRLSGDEMEKNSEIQSGQMPDSYRNTNNPRSSDKETYRAPDGVSLNMVSESALPGKPTGPEEAGEARASADEMRAYRGGGTKGFLQGGGGFGDARERELEENAAAPDGQRDLRKLQVGYHCWRGAKGGRDDDLTHP